ncbi:variant 3 [Lathyrus oleraceus]|uniref:Variant 3 n=1 Tax=Pisum sativum TaxID=3888 RepID=A0A9D4XUZ9_PEA|nr:variant 3 [Pisum sativum]
MATSLFTSLLPFTSSTTSHSNLSPFRAFRVSASISVPENHFQHTPRREFLKGVALSLPLIVLTEPPPSQARDVAVGSFLPPSSDPSFVLFKASAKDTPALRAVLCRKCAAIPIHPSPNMETASYS